MRLDPVHKVEIRETVAGRLRRLSPTDCIKNRLAAVFHRNDTMAFQQALLVAKAQPIDRMDLRRWAKAEGAAEKFKAFENV